MLGLLLLVCLSHFLEHTWFLRESKGSLCDTDFWLVGESKISFIIPREIPNEDTIVSSYTYHLLWVSWVEHNTIDRIVMTYKCLEVVRCSLLGLIVPYFNHVVVTSSEEVS